MARRLGLPEPIYRSHPRKLMRNRIQRGGYVSMNMNGINCPISNGLVLLFNLDPVFIWIVLFFFTNCSFLFTTIYYRFINGPSVGPVCPPIPRSFSSSTSVGSGVPSSTISHLPSTILPNAAIAHPFGPLNPTVPCHAPFDQSGRLCIVSVAIGPGRIFTGFAHTFAQAKAHAATQALDEKIKLDEQKKKEVQKICIENCTPIEIQENSTMDCEQDQQIVNEETIPKHKQKSVISQVHECALQMKLNVEFEDMKMDPSYGHQINPVSRLIQVLQARNEEDPQFELVGEHGQSRYKEFTVQVMCSGRICTGNGPNKRLAKRAAAEAMLAEIGYVKPLPPPGKSLLKKKGETQMQIGGQCNY
uniref:DRBM domain-containing protein n=1 Tax=Heterorhabditis bacteriophora TaxID=37862 RepID=A0A1I7X4P6_HETBA